MHIQYTIWTIQTKTTIWNFISTRSVQSGNEKHGRHHRALRKAFEVAQSSNLHLNKEKCQFGVDELTFLGDILSAEGQNPSHGKARDVQGVRRFLGMITYLAKWIPDMAKKTEPL